MRVCFLSDPGNADGSVGGAELTMGEFAAAAPDDVDLGRLGDCDTVVVGNCTSFGPDLILDLLSKQRVVWYHNDLSSHIHPGLRAWLNETATNIFCSPLQRDAYGLDGELIPPAIDLDRFQPNGGEGAVSIGSWQNPGKGQQALMEWASKNGPLDVFGTGPYIPSGGPLDFKGPLEPGQVPDTLAGYETFVHLPWVIEPYGRCVVEAWASGLSLVANRNVGALYWINERPEGLENAAQRFWEVVLND